MPKPTPAPWRYNKINNFITAYTKPKEPVICEVAKIPEYEANAHLIAAAPELLGALKDVYPHIYDDALRSRIGTLIVKTEGK